MNRFYVIAMDVHSYSSHVVVATPSGRTRDDRTVSTSIPALCEVIRSTPRPRRVVFEEGPLAGWLYRNLRHEAEEVIVAETRRNAYIAKDGDKSDPIDAAKLAQLDQGGFIRAVHHAANERSASFKELVLFYRKCVDQRVARANRLIWAVRAHGVVIREKHFAEEAARSTMVEQLPRDRMVRLRIEMLLDDYDRAVEHEQRSREELIRRARKVKVIRWFTEVPQIGWVRAATFYALIDTPFRFRKKSALWRYMGIGLQRRGSGAGKEQVKTSPACNHHLKDIMLGAAQRVASSRAENPFTQLYRRCLDRGLSPRVARRTVARAMALTMWGMWKSQTRYRPDWVSVPAGELLADRWSEH